MRSGLIEGTCFFSLAKNHIEAVRLDAITQNAGGSKMERLLQNVRTIGERPECREVIIREGLLPDVLRDARGRLFWDGQSARRPDGSRALYGVGVPNGLQLELKKMAVDNFWGNLKSVTLSWHRYSLLRDAIDGKIRGSSVNASMWWPADHANGDRQKRR